jgi:hypothetical protein
MPKDLIGHLIEVAIKTFPITTKCLPSFQLKMHVVKMIPEVANSENGNPLLRAAKSL